MFRDNYSTGLNTLILCGTAEEQRWAVAAKELLAELGINLPVLIADGYRVSLIELLKLSTERELIKVLDSTDRYTELSFLADQYNLTLER